MNSRRLRGNCTEQEPIWTARRVVRVCLLRTRRQGRFERGPKGTIRIVYRSLNPIWVLVQKSEVSPSDLLFYLAPIFIPPTIPKDGIPN